MLTAQKVRNIAKSVAVVEGIQEGEVAVRDYHLRGQNFIIPEQFKEGLQGPAEIALLFAAKENTSNLKGLPY